MEKLQTAFEVFAKSSAHIIDSIAVTSEPYKVKLLLPTKPKNNHYLKKMCYVEYYSPRDGNLRRIRVWRKERNGSVFLEYRGTEVELYKVPVLAMRPCFPFLDYNEDVWIVETISAKDKVVEVALVHVAYKIITKTIDDDPDAPQVVSELTKSNPEELRDIWDKIAERGVHVCRWISERNS